jgi:hypothetical protein
MGEGGGPEGGGPRQSVTVWGRRRAEAVIIGAHSPSGPEQEVAPVSLWTKMFHLFRDCLL